MNTNDSQIAIERLIQATISRAWRESIAGLIVISVFVAILQRTDVGSAAYYGCLLIIIGAGFICGVVWSFALGYKLLETHPAAERAFWRAAFQSQARLLRLVPIWYCAPLFVGMLLMIGPVAPEMYLAFALLMLIMVSLFGFVIWLNRRVAIQLEQQGNKLLGTREV